MVYRVLVRLVAWLMVLVPAAFKRRLLDRSPRNCKSYRRGVLSVSEAAAITLMRPDSG
jgi:hypothetical protein